MWFFFFILFFCISFFIVPIEQYYTILFPCRRYAFRVGNKLSLVIFDNLYLWGLNYFVKKFYFVKRFSNFLTIIVFFQLFTYFFVPDCIPLYTLSISCSISVGFDVWVLNLLRSYTRFGVSSVLQSVVFP